MSHFFNECKKAELRGLIAGCAAEERVVVLMTISYTEKIFSRSGKDISYCHWGSVTQKEQLGSEQSAIELWMKDEFGITWRPGEPRQIQLSVPKSKASSLLESNRSFKYTCSGYALTPSELTEYNRVSRVTTTTVTLSR